MITRDEVLARRAIMAKAAEYRAKREERRKQLWQLPRIVLIDMLKGEELPRLLHRPDLIESILKKEFAVTQK